MKTQKQIERLLQPLGNRLLISASKAEKKIGSLFIPEQARETPAEYTVVRLGTGAKDKKGNDIPFEVKVGDKILTTKYGGSEVKFGDSTFKIIGADEVLAIIQ